MNIKHYVIDLKFISCLVYSLDYFKNQEITVFLEYKPKNIKQKIF